MPSTIQRRGKKGIFQYNGHWNGRKFRESLVTTIKAEAQRKQRELDVTYASSDYLPLQKKIHLLTSFGENMLHG